MSVMQFVDVPPGPQTWWQYLLGRRPRPGRNGFAVIVEIPAEEWQFLDHVERLSLCTRWESFAADMGAAACYIGRGESVTFYDVATAGEPGLCPSMLETLIPDMSYCCELLDGHAGLHSANHHVPELPTTTWGVRVPWVSPSEA